MKGIDLTPKQRKAAELLATGQYTQKEVADMLGISQSYISRIEKNVIKWSYFKATNK